MSHNSKVRRVNEIYRREFSQVIPFFTREYFSLIDLLSLKKYKAGEVIYDFNDVPTMFYAIKCGSIRHEGATTPIIKKVEGEWFGFESFVCGPYASMT